LDVYRVNEQLGFGFPAELVAALMRMGLRNCLGNQLGGAPDPQVIVNSVTIQETG